MGDQRRPLQPGEYAPAFALPSANQEGTVSLASLHGHPFLIAFFRGLHCPFCRRQVGQLGGLQPALRAAGVETVAVINTPVERARMYFGHRPTPAVLLCDQDCSTHRAFGVPHAEFLPEDSREEPAWPYRASMAQFEAVRINPTGELPEALHPMAANPVLNAQDGFELCEVDNATSQTSPHSLSGTSSSMPTASFVGCKLKRATGRPAPASFRRRCSLLPAASATESGASLTFVRRVSSHRGTSALGQS